MDPHLFLPDCPRGVSVVICGTYPERIHLATTISNAFTKYAGLTRSTFIHSDPVPEGKVVWCDHNKFYGTSVSSLQSHINTVRTRRTVLIIMCTDVESVYPMSVYADYFFHPPTGFHNVRSHLRRHFHFNDALMNVTQARFFEIKGGVEFFMRQQDTSIKELFIHHNVLLATLLRRRIVLSRLATLPPEVEQYVKSFLG